MSEATVAAGDNLGALIAGYVMAFVLPIGGFIAGCLLIDRHPVHGVAMLMLSVWSGTFFGWLILSALG